MTEETDTMRPPAAVLVIAITCCLAGMSCKKSTPKPKIDPHSPEAVNLALQQQQEGLNQAFRTNNLLFIHDQMYYIDTFIAALSRKVQGEKKARVDAILQNLKAITYEIDISAGHRHREATEISLRRFDSALKELDAELRPKGEPMQKK